jgi:cytochrome oxidase Cu insertion factor (SCO1/SenC/PrrC family)
MIARIAAGSVIAAALWATVAAAQPAAAPPAWEKMGVQVYESPKPAPAFVLPALDGRSVRLEDYRGKALLLFFWATW